MSSSNNQSILTAALQASLLFSLWLAAGCTIQARITDLSSSGTFTLLLSGNSYFETTSSTTYTSTKQSITIIPTITGSIASFFRPVFPQDLH